MRTKTILLSAACGLLGSLAANAGSVYSVNVVGYVNKTFTGGKYTMFVNPLNSTNTYASLFSSLTDADTGCKLYVWDPAGNKFKSAVFAGVTDGGWFDSNDNDVNLDTLVPGQGAWLYSRNNITITFVGDVLTGSLTKSLSAGWNQVGSIVPQAGDIATLGLTNPNNNDKVYKFTDAGWESFVYPGDGDNFWYNANDDVVVPSLDVAEAVWYKSTAAFVWSRTFNINQ
jgi:hypothetical protein